MHKALAAAISGIAGIAIGAGGWALLGPEKTVHDQAVTAGAAPAATGARHYSSAQAIADALEKAGFTVSMLHQDTSTAITDMGGTAYDFTVTEKPGPAPGDSGINVFPNHEALTTWVGLSKSFGGIAVTGNTWAVSLASDGAARTSSAAMAPRIARVLGGTVQK